MIIDRVIGTASGRGIPFGLPTPSPEDLLQYVVRGATLPVLGGDLRFLMEAAEESLKRARSLLQTKTRERAHDILKGTTAPQ